MHLSPQPNGNAIRSDVVVDNAKPVSEWGRKIMNSTYFFFSIVRLQHTDRKIRKIRSIFFFANIDHIFSTFAIAFGCVCPLRT